MQGNLKKNQISKQKEKCSPYIIFYNILFIHNDTKVSNINKCSAFELSIDQITLKKTS